MLDRREFLKSLGGGILVVLTLEEVIEAQESGRRGGAEPLPENVGAWLHVGKDGKVTAYTGKIEAGQGARTELTQVVAEELRVAPGSVEMIMGDTALTPFDMGTFGSQTTPRMVPQMRKAAAAARVLLIELAAQKWGVERSSLVVADSRITEPKSGRTIVYGELTQGQKLVRTISDTVPQTPPDQWKIEGTPLKKVNARDIVTGRHRFPYDIVRPGIQFGKVLRPAAFGATLASLDASGAEAIPGVKVVRDGDFAGVVAPDRATAEKAASLVKAEWKSEQQPSRAELFEYLKKHPEGRVEPQQKGSVDQGLTHADVRVKQTYTVQYIAHTPLEPRAAVAEWQDGKVTVWTGTQRPFGVRSELMSLFHLDKDQVRVIMPDTGSGYGGKHYGDAALEAARLAKAVGKPVRVLWTREEEFTWAYFRPAGVIDVEAGAKKDGTITAWDFLNTNSGPAGMQFAYEIPNFRIRFQPAHTPLRQGSYRALAATANHFARETAIDELAHEAGMDPLEFRLANIQEPRFRAVLEAAAERFGWRRMKPAPGHGFGVAAGWEKGGYVATCAEVSVKRPGGEVKIERVVEAFECGAVINPVNLRNQVEGAIIMGIGGAMFEAVDFANGKILNARLRSYRVPRFTDIPLIDTIILDRKDLPSSGAGECPIVGIAPAVGNAIFGAAGVRLRSLPLVPKGLPA